MKLSDVWPDAVRGADGESGVDEARIRVADLADGQALTSYFVCPEREVKTTKNGGTMVNLTLLDASGQVKAVHFDPSEDVVATLSPGSVVKVQGRYRVDARWGPQVVVERLRVLEEGEYDPAALIPVSPVSPAELRARLAELVSGVREPHVQALLQRALDPGREPGATFAVAPAALRNHHAYRHGLIEHSVVVAEVAGAVADRLPSVDRDLVVAGALLHDIGKIASYSSDPFAPGFTDPGRLQGEIVLGHELVRGLMAEIEGFPPDLSLRLGHIIVAHHGEREKGSPVVPMTREAIVVHFCDDMTARVAAVDDAERAAAPGDRWSAYSRMLETFVYLGDGESGAEHAGREAPARPSSVAAPADEPDDEAPSGGAHAQPADDDAPDDGRLPFMEA